MYLYDVAWRKSLLQKRFVCELHAEVKGILNGVESER